MGNSQLQTFQKHDQPVSERKPVCVKIGIACLGFVPCVHFVCIEGIDGWVAYEAPMVMKCFFKNSKHFVLDSKFMPELEIERPDITHFEWYENLSAIDPNDVIEMHKRALLTGSLIGVSHT